MRLDFLRGLALLLICVNHSELMSGFQVLSFLTYRPLGFSDAALLFVFVSGYLLGNRYIVKLERNGLLDTVGRLWSKAFKLYALNLALYALILAGSYFAVRFFGWSFAGYFGFDEVLRAPLPHLLDALTLRSYPYLLDILPFFAVLFAAAAFILFAVSRFETLSALVSITLYLFAQLRFLNFIPDLFTITPYIYFLFSWQFLFFIAVYLGVKARKGRLRVTYNRAFLITAWTVLALLFFQDKILVTVRELGWADLGFLSGPLFNKRFLTPLLLLHFIILAYLFPRLVPDDKAFRRSAFAGPFIVCGRNSMRVFSFQILVCFFAGIFMRQVGATAPSILFLDTAAVALCVGFAYLVDRMGKTVRRANVRVVIAPGAGSK